MNDYKPVYDSLKQDKKPDDYDYVMIAASGELGRLNYALELADRLEALRRVGKDGVIIIDVTQSEFNNLEDIVDKLPENVRIINVMGISRLAPILAYHLLDKICVYNVKDAKDKSKERSYANNLFRIEEERSRSMEQKVSRMIQARRRF